MINADLSLAFLHHINNYRPTSLKIKQPTSNMLNYLSLIINQCSRNTIDYVLAIQQ